MKNFQGPKEAGGGILFRDEAQKKTHSSCDFFVLVFELEWCIFWPGRGGKSEILQKKVRMSGFFHPKEFPIYKDRWNNPLIRSPLILTNFQRHGTSKYNTLGSPQRHGKPQWKVVSQTKKKSRDENVHIPPFKLSFLVMFPSFIFWRAEEGLSTFICGQLPKRTAKNMKKEWSQPTSFSAMSPSIKLEESETIHLKPQVAFFKKGLPTVRFLVEKGVLNLEAYTEDSVERTMVYQFFSNRNVKRLHTPMKKIGGVCFFYLMPTGEKLKFIKHSWWIGCFDRSSRWNNFSTERREQ